MTEALRNERLRETLLLDAANEYGKTVDLDVYRRAVDLALSKALWVEGREAGHKYLSEVKRSLENLLA